MAAALAGTFSFDGKASDLFARLGALSAYPRIKYWSTSAKTWKPLVLEAGALKSADIGQVRSDFSSIDLIAGNVLYYFERDENVGEVVYLLNVVEADEKRLVLASENITAVRQYGLPLFAARSVQTLQVIERLSPTEWGFYQIVFTRGGLNRFVPGHTASYLNRLAAIFRHVAGLRTDQDPPVER